MRRTTLATGLWRASRSSTESQLTGSLAWCLPTGFSTPVTYFYLGYFVVLLLHRQMRDDHACKGKYGSDWDRVSRRFSPLEELISQYCELVPWKIIPYVVSGLAHF